MLHFVAAFSLHFVPALAAAVKLQEAATVYATDLELLKGRADGDHLASMAKDFLELQGGGDDATEMRRFVGKYADVLQREKGAAVMQLALQQPDVSAVFRAAASQLSSKPTRTLKWHNKPQEKDACIATLPHKSQVGAVAVSAKRIVGGSGDSVFVYDAETEQLLEELQCTSAVTSVAIWDGREDDLCLDLPYRVQSRCDCLSIRNDWVEQCLSFPSALRQLSLGMARTKGSRCIMCVTPGIHSTQPLCPRERAARGPSERVRRQRRRTGWTSSAPRLLR